jgi:hypothetical protein
MYDESEHRSCLDIFSLLFAERKWLDLCDVMVQLGCRVFDSMHDDERIYCNTKYS